jgi:predicted GNAT superfamily acetyltransferase
MHDAVNRGDRTDRLSVVWDLTQSRQATVKSPRAAHVLRVGEDFEPNRVPPTTDPWLVAIPPDIERIRREDPSLADRWRVALRSVLTDALTDDLRITGFTGTGAYLLERK